MFVYVIKEHTSSKRLKIGHSENPLARLHQLQTGSSYKLELLSVARCFTKQRAAELERLLHAELAQFKCGKGGDEWFSRQALPFIEKIGRKPPGAATRQRFPACAVFADHRIKGLEPDVISALKIEMHA